MTDIYSQPPDEGMKSEEVAEVHVRGRVFTDWETVWVQHRWKEDQPTFRFTCAERGGEQVEGETWIALRFRPGDLVEIWLGGVLAITGGTGKYRNARGEMELHSRNPAGTEFDFVFHVIG